MIGSSSYMFADDKTHANYIETGNSEGAFKLGDTCEDGPCLFVSGGIMLVIENRAGDHTVL
jgi:hypothetical protein